MKSKNCSYHLMTMTTVGSLIFPDTAFAAAPPPPDAPVGFLPPVLGDILGILSLVLSVLLMCVVAWLWLSGQQQKTALKKISRLTTEVAQLSKRISELESRLNPTVAPAPEPEQKKTQENSPSPAGKKEAVWQSFLENFNHLAHSIDIPAADKACANFIAMNKLTLLYCQNHAANSNGNPAPEFATAKNMESSTFWAYLLPGSADRYAVVPNPLNPYQQELHEEGGMKETFASNYELGTCRHMAVKLPALLRNNGSEWMIDQPGVIHLEP